MSTASRGRALEHEIREIMRQAGYSVIRGAGSKGEIDLGDGPEKMDLVCTRVTTGLDRTLYIVAIQCKLKRRTDGAK